MSGESRNGVLTGVSGASYCHLIAPRRPPGLAGLLRLGASLVVDRPRLAVVMDYQNIHLTARDCYAPYGTAAEHVLIHPLLFAERLVSKRNSLVQRYSQEHQGAELTAVLVFRGAPGNQQQPRLYAITQAQRSEWTRDSRVSVHYRPLKYVPGKPTQEKGIDVLVALTLVEAAQSDHYEVVVLAAHDTDLEPALDFADRGGRVKIETAGWDGSRRLRVPGKSFWHTSLTGADMVHTRDRKDYSVYG